MKVLVLDNYDSFTYNLVQYLGELGAEVHTVRNDRVTVDELVSGAYDRCVVSPGPCTPDQAGISLELVRRMPECGVPTLGVCLGHQALAQAFGGLGITLNHPYCALKGRASEETPLDRRGPAGASQGRL